MSKNLIIMNSLILIYVLQRIGELMLSKNNEEWLRSHHEAAELNPAESLRMRAFHMSWFIGLFLEANYRHTFQTPLISLIIYLALAGCMLVRLHSMGQLKKFWSIKVFSMKNPVIAVNGLYRYVRHPNYFIVICELFLIPFLFKAYVTMVIFSLINLYILSRRILVEESSLMLHPTYKNHFSGKKRFIPFIFALCLVFTPLHAKEIIVHSPSYAEAKKNENYLKFQSTSTKLGFITTSFDGYALDFKVNYDEKEQVISKIDVLLPVKSLDSDVHSRDEKMHNEIMDAEKFPNLKVSSSESLKLKAGDQVINMVFTVKERQLSKPVHFVLAEKDNAWKITGKTHLGLQEIGLPDPSIAIAKVRDQFDIDFEIVLRDR